MHLIEKAQALATQAHAGVKRKFGGRDYICHPQEVYEKVMTLGGLSDHDREVLGCVAWMHDVIEDCPNVKPADIAAEFGNEVLAGILAVTNPARGTKRRRFWKLEILEHLKRAPPNLQRLKLCDCIVNLNDLAQCDEIDYLALQAKEKRDLLATIGNCDPTLAEEMLSAIVQLESRVKQSRKRAGDG